MDKAVNESLWTTTVKDRCGLPKELAEFGIIPLSKTAIEYPASADLRQAFNIQLDEKIFAATVG